MIDPKTTKKYDAVLVPAQYPAGKAGPARLIALKQEFAADLGAKNVFSQFVGGSMNLLSAAPTHQYHGDGHPNAGEDRYDWVDRGDGVSYGILTEASKTTPEERETAEAEATEAAKSKRQQELLTRYEALSAIPDAELGTGERAELDRLKRFLPVMFPDYVKPVAPKSPASGVVPGPSSVSPAANPAAPVSDAKAKAIGEAASGKS